MTIFLTAQEYYELFQEAGKEQMHLDTLDKLDVTWKSDGGIVQGWEREIQLRGGISLYIEKTQLDNRIRVTDSQIGAPFRWEFYLSGKEQRIYLSSGQETSFSLDSGQYLLSGKGLQGKHIADSSDKDPFLRVAIEIQPKVIGEVLGSFIGDPEGELPQVFKHLIDLSNGDGTVVPAVGDRYKRTGKISPIVHPILQQILQCPYQGLTKRMYLEGKATELMALMLEEEAAFQQGEFKTSLLQADQLDRIHYAKEILLKNLSNPPSLMELACQIGMCDYNLKQGFKEVFGTTVFGYLRDRRLEKAQQLLLEQNMSVATVARAVGYDSRTSFTFAFKRKYGVSPKAYQISARK